jgi:hypothetical protein
MCHCERSESQGIATPACRNSILLTIPLFKHSGVQARRFAPRNDYFSRSFTIVWSFGYGVWRTVGFSRVAERSGATSAATRC